MTWANEATAETPAAPCFCLFTQFQVLPASFSPLGVTAQGRNMTEVGTEERAQWVKGLLSKQDPRFGPQHPSKKMALACNPRAGEVEGGGSQGASWKRLRPFSSCQEADRHGTETIQ